VGLQPDRQGRFQDPLEDPGGLGPR